MLGIYHQGMREARTQNMAAKYIYRKKFPLLATGALCILQPLLSGSISAAQQYDCKVSASGGWACSTQESQAARPPRPEPLVSVSSSKIGRASCRERG